jgi:hypothetical protein
VHPSKPARKRLLLECSGRNPPSRPTRFERRTGNLRFVQVHIKVRLACDGNHLYKSYAITAPRMHNFRALCISTLDGRLYTG